MEVIEKYFPALDQQQTRRLSELKEMYLWWNAKINVISRKDIDQLYERHVLHSLVIAKVVAFKPGTAVLDAGTGGGFPGIPLAVLFPGVDFCLADSIGKKIKVVREIAAGLGLKNVRAVQQRVETFDRRFDFVVSRAVTRLPVFYSWVQDTIRKSSSNTLDNGILYLKGGELGRGGELAEEISALNRPVTCYPVNDFFEEAFFNKKYIIHVPAG